MRQQRSRVPRACASQWVFKKKKRLLEWFRTESDDQMKNHSQIHDHIGTDRHDMMATSCLQFENSVNRSLSQILKLWIHMHIKIDEIWNFFLYLDSELPENVGVRVCMLSHVQLCSPFDCSPPGSFVHGISQARIVEWVEISSSRGSSRPRDWAHVSCVSCSDRGILTAAPPVKSREHGCMFVHICCTHKILWYL